MKLYELWDYNCWLGKTAAQVHFAAMQVGGWKAVFPGRVPRWASKVRNYFNVTPNTLKRVTKIAAGYLTAGLAPFSFWLDCHDRQTYNRAHAYQTPLRRVPPGCPVKASPAVRNTGFRDRIGIDHALSGDVYVDERERVWFQMSAGATIYHWGSEPRWAAWEAFWVNTFRGQDDTPVFKLISPDSKTGGSCEVIISNGGGWETIGKEGQVMDVSRAIVTDPASQGSYNYAETTLMGLAAHERRDVNSHVAGSYFYANPKNPLAPLAQRWFPIHDDQGKVLATQD